MFKSEESSEFLGRVNIGNPLQYDDRNLIKYATTAYDLSIKEQKIVGSKNPKEIEEYRNDSINLLVNIGMPKKWQ